jgi:hypothetical protein
MVVAGVVHQLEAFTSARSSGFSLEVAPGDLPVGIAHEEAERMVWRILATLAGAARPGEILALNLSGESATIRLVAALPEGLAALEDVFAPSPALSGQAVNAGVFGNGFTLRLAGAEARAAGGSLVRERENLVLDLPALRNGEFANLQNTDIPVASAAE